jgi:hypothetical protein
MEEETKKEMEMVKGKGGKWRVGRRERERENKDKVTNDGELWK